MQRNSGGGQTGGETAKMFISYSFIILSRKIIILQREGEHG